MFESRLGIAHEKALKLFVDELGWIAADTTEIVRYNQSARHGTGNALAVIRPRTSAEVSKILAYCVNADIQVVPQSGNTGLVLGSVADASRQQLLMSLERLQSIETDTDNRTAVVGAGVRLSALNAALAELELIFPIDVSSDPSIGGMIATNTGGSRLLKYGDVRQHALGLTIVLADAEGTVIQLGRGLRKDNSGIDWKQLFIGSSGVFGIITKAELALTLRPQQQAAVLLVPSGYAVIPELLRAMELQFGDALTAFEGMSKAALERGMGDSPVLKSAFPEGNIPPYVILAEISRSYSQYQGEIDIEQWLTIGLESIFSDAELLADAMFGNYQQLWALRHGLSSGVQSTGYLVPFDLSFKRNKAVQFIEDVEAELMKKHAFSQVTLCHFGHIGDGGVHLNFVIEHAVEEEHQIQISEALKTWVFSKAVEEYQGSFSAEHGVGPVNNKIYQLYTGYKCKLWADGFSELSSANWLGNSKFGRDSEEH